MAAQSSSAKLGAMPRWAWILAVLVTVGAALTAGVLVVQAPLDERPITAAAVAGIAAAVQAATAIIIVLLTSRLVTAARESQGAATAAIAVAAEQAQSARDSITIARDQLELSDRSDQHARRDRQLLAVPMLAAKYETHSDFEGDLTLVITVHNTGDSAALGIRCTVRGKDGRRQPPSPHFAMTSRDEPLPAGNTAGLALAMNDFRNIDVGIENHDRPRDVWTYPWFAVIVEYRALLGQRITLEYSFWADRPTGPGSPEWYLERLHVDLDVEGSEPVELQF